MTPAAGRTPANPGGSPATGRTPANPGGSPATGRTPANPEGSPATGRTPANPEGSPAGVDLGTAGADHHGPVGGEPGASPDGLGLPSLGGRRSLREQVSDSLRALLVSGRLRPGELYSAPGLAAEFGVSPTPVREAMLDLVREGLVEPVKNKGFRVTAMSDAELDALAELRGLIEVPVMTAVARDADATVRAEVEALRPLARSMVDAAAAKDLARYVALDAEFHLRFLALHGNEYVVEVVRDLRGRSRLFGLAEMAERGTLPGNAAEHEQMVDLALSGDADGMEALVRVHIAQLRAAWA